jgi:hypothetical protein
MNRMILPAVAVLMLAFGVSLMLAGLGEVRLATAALAQAAGGAVALPGRVTIPEFCYLPAPIGTGEPESR